MQGQLRNHVVSRADLRVAPRRALGPHRALGTLTPEQYAHQLQQDKLNRLSG
jgi:hypothetical protein